MQDPQNISTMLQTRDMDKREEDIFSCAQF
jgi:hypothetical protein